MSDILPRHDFYVAVLDSQQLVMDPMPEEPGPLRNEPPPIYDPAEMTQIQPTFNDAQPEDLVLLMGYPMGGDHAGKLVASVARVLGEAEALDAIDVLSAAGDEEGDIAYDPEVEILVEGRAADGMSGGAAFDAEGRLVGILVRASTEEIGTQYVRVVRMAFVTSRLDETFQSLDPSVQAAVSPYLDNGS